MVRSTIAPNVSARVSSAAPCKVPYRFWGEGGRMREGVEDLRAEMAT